MSVLNRLQDLSLTLWNARDLETALDAILEASIDLLAADSGNMQLLETDSRCLKIVAQRGLSPMFVGAFKRMSPGDSLVCARAWEEGERFIVEDVGADDRFEGTRKIAAETGLQALVSVPLLSRSDERLGVLSVHFRRPHRPSDRDLQVLDWYMRQAADFVERLRAEQGERETAQRLRLATRSAKLSVFEWNADRDVIIWEGGHAPEVFGRGREEALTTSDFFNSCLHPDDTETFRQALKVAMRPDQPFQTVCRIRRPDEDVCWIEIAGDFQLGADGSPERLVGVLSDVTERKQADALLDSQRQVLELIAGARPLAEVLASIVRIVEEQCGAGVVGTVALFDGGSERITQCIAPGLPEDFCRAIEGDCASPESRLHPAAAAVDEPVVFADIASDARWDGQRDLPSALGLRSAFSIPIRSRDDRILGVLAVYFRERREPSPRELQVVRALAPAAALAIERRRADRVLRENERHFRQLADSMPQLVWRAGPDGIVDYYNSRVSEYAGACCASDGSWDWEPLVHEDELEPTRAAWQQAVQTRTAYQVEHRVRMANGSCRWHLSRALPLQDEDGKVTWFGTATDINDHKLAEDALAQITAESERRRRLFETVLSNTPDQVFVFGLDHRFVYANESLLRMWGREWGEAIGRNCLELGYEPWHAEMHDREIDQVITSKKPVKGCVPFEGTNGRRDYEYIFVPVLGADGEVEAVAGTSRDVTERQRAEEALRESDQFTRRVLDSLFSFVGVLDLDGTVISANRAPLETAGLSIETVGGKKIWNSPWWNDSAHARRLVRRACGRAAKGEMVRFDLPIRIGEDDQMIIDFQIAPLRNLDGEITHLVPSAVDITERKRVEEALAAAKQAAEAANASKSEFLANMSHEIRTPMAAVLGYAEILLRSLDDPDNRNCVEIIKRNGKFLLNIINDILDLSRIEAGRFEVERRRFAPDALVAEVCSLMAVPAHEKNLPLRIDFEGELPEAIESDPTRLRQILINLIGNAIKFTENGEVRLSVRFLPETKKIRFDVIDSGMGISPREQDRLFQPFHQVDTSAARQFGGSGLGLAISRRLASMLGGEITVESEIGCGSTFSLTVEVGSLAGIRTVRPRGEIVTDEERELRPLPALDCRVLVVDDRGEVRRLVQHFIEEAGGETRSAATGARALDQWRAACQQGEVIDAVLMDMQMPEMDGYEATRRLRDAGFTGVIIAITAHAMEGDREKCLRAGCDAYLSKPIEPRELVETLLQCTGQSAPRVETTGDEAVAEAPAPTAVTEEAAAGARRVLVVEDDAGLAEVLRFMLAADGHEVKVAQNGREAIDVAGDWSPRAIVMDLGLPDMSGSAVVEKLKGTQGLEHATWIALSGRSEEEERSEALESGFDHYLVKPPDFEELRRLVSSAGA